jgi:hypothetical protein
MQIAIESSATAVQINPDPTDVDDAVTVATRGLARALFCLGWYRDLAIFPVRCRFSR